MSRCIVGLMTTWMLAATCFAAVEDNTGAKLSVYPPAINLGSAADSNTFVAQVFMPDGTTRDVTQLVTLEVRDPTFLRIDGNKVFPVADGQTEISFIFEDQKIVIPVSIAQATVTPPVSFNLDVMPIFMKTGCNSGSCHGAARGKDGFRLSLFGFDPAGDYFRLTREMIGRRINLAIPESSLVIEKTTAAVPHTGGDQIKVNDPNYQTMIQWLHSGAVADPAPTPAVTRVEIFPPGGVLNGEGASQRLSVRATYADGTDRDVTRLAYFLTSNDNSAMVDQSGLVTAKNRGEAFVMARFNTYTVGVPFIVLPKDFQFQWTDVKENNYVDTLVHQKLKKLRIQPSDVCSDADFARRVFLDICGLVPTAAELTAFQADADPDKRSKLITQLLARPEFVEVWVMKWSELLTIRSSQQVSYKAALLYYNWLQQQIASNVRVDEMVKKLLGSVGGTFSSPATNYYQNEQDSLKVAENVAQVFFGMRIQCAQCHNHPFDRWTMDDYYGFAAFFSQIGRKPGQDPRETIVFNRGGGEVQHLVTKQNVVPKFLGGIQPDMAGRDRREVVAEWLVGPDNPYFSRNLVNLVWAHFMGRGIVEPVDDVRVSNPPANQELLDQLSKNFVEYGYDFKHLVADICNSRTYQLSTQTNPTNVDDVRNFSHANIRRLRAEVLLDVISQITETKNKFRGLPVGARAVQIADGNTSNYFLSTFGRARRETVCSCEVKTEPNLGQALHLINGDTLQSKIAQGGVVARLIQEGKTPDQVVDELYLRCLSRVPNETEKQQVIQLVNTDEDKTRALNDVFWALLNSREFVFCH